MVTCKRNARRNVNAHIIFVGGDTPRAHLHTYTGQYHTARPYIPVTSIPNFDPKQLPYWDIYEREDTAATIKIGGTMAGEFVAGLSGGQRKLLLFELLRQRVAAVTETKLLIVLDEPFAGVTDGFVPFIVDRLNEMREQHNIVLVTNDHIQVLKEMADNILTVSAIDRSTVRINNRDAVDRRKALVALSGVGERYQYKTGSADLKFFWNVEVRSNSALLGILGFVIFLFGMFLLTFWNSKTDSASLILIAGEILSYFGLNPYLLSAIDWRNYMKEEAEALMHASISTNLFLRTALTLFFGFLIWNLEFLVVNLAADGLDNIDIWTGLMFDNLSTTLPFIIMGLYTSATQQDVEVIGSLPFLLMIFLSTAYSPGAGIPGLKELRYIFPKFYLWCFVPGVEDQMEGCPEARGGTLLFLALSSFFFSSLFLGVKWLGDHKERKKTKKRDKSVMELLDDDFESLQVELYGEKQGRENFARLQKKMSSFAKTSSHGSTSSKMGD